MTAKTKTYQVVAGARMGWTRSMAVAATSKVEARRAVHAEWIRDANREVGAMCFTSFFVYQTS